MSDATDTIRVNGETRPFATGNVVDLLRRLGHGDAPRALAVAVNGQVVRRAEWSERVLRPGDEVEIVGAVQGG